MAQFNKIVLDVAATDLVTSAFEYADPFFVGGAPSIAFQAWFDRDALSTTTGCTFVLEGTLDPEDEDAWKPLVWADLSEPTASAFATEHTVSASADASGYKLLATANVQHMKACRVGVKAVGATGVAGDRARVRGVV